MTIRIEQKQYEMAVDYVRLASTDDKVQGMLKLPLASDCRCEM